MFSLKICFGGMSLSERGCSDVGFESFECCAEGVEDDADVPLN